MFTRKTFVVIFLLSFALILMIAGCCLLPPPTPNTYTITSSAGEGGTISPLGETMVTEGNNQSFTITADEGHEVSDVLVDGESAGALTAYTFNNIQQDHTISVNFIQQTQPPPIPTVIRYTITASAGEGGSIDPEGSVKIKKGKDQTFIINPDDYFQIYDVLVDDVSVGAVDAYTFINVKKNHTIEAIFSGIHNQDKYYLSIQEAIDDSEEDDTIIVSPGIYSEKIVFDGKNITVRGTDIDNPDIVNNTIIRGNQNGSVVQFINSDTSTLQGFTITNGKSYNGGGIDVYNNSSPTISFNKISGNMADTTGGGIYVYGNSSPTISYNEITGNTANEGGGIYVDSDSSPTIGGSDATDTGNFNTICGNSPDQVDPDSYPNNYICNTCPCP